jgi:nascent polypeptide-associated complex subunit alpha
MIPGLGGGNPRQMAMMMKKLGIDVRDIHDVQEVVIRTPTKDYVFTDATVSVMKAQGVETWQISGSPEEREHELKLVVSEEDVQMVMDQAGVDEATARQALEDAGGDLAEAIVALSG